MSRLHYCVGIDGLQKIRKKALLVLDESDAVIFSDVEKFYKLTTKTNFKIVCFSATVSDSKEEGSE